MFHINDSMIVYFNEVLWLCNWESTLTSREEMVVYVLTACYSKGTKSRRILQETFTVPKELSGFVAQIIILEVGIEWAIG